MSSTLGREFVGLGGALSGPFAGVPTLGNLDGVPLVGSASRVTSVSSDLLCAWRVLEPARSASVTSSWSAAARVDVLLGMSWSARARQGASAAARWRCLRRIPSSETEAIWATERYEEEFEELLILGLPATG